MNIKTLARHKGIIALTIGAVGVVFGDIGTSPLYSINEIFFGIAFKNYQSVDVLGAISLVFWALTIVVALKYVFFVLRADSEGEGGVFALYSLIANLPKASLIITGLLIFAAGLLYGDGIITPAISVVSAVEGLKIMTVSLEPYIVPITILILTGLFSIQRFGTHKVGKVFGPIMLVWFITLGLLGFNSLRLTPGILQALNPIYAFQFFTTHSFHTILLTLGSVMLVITGGEAMYADMGHFGRLPIRLGWYLVAYPMLILNYLGQGAYLLSGKEVANGNIFYSMVPQHLLLFMVILSTMATIIASQALISGAFSLTTQAISLRLLPYMRVTHTSASHEGQIYIPAINTALYIGSVALVLIFRSSTKLAGAYGLAVSGVMFVTTIGMIVVASKIWHWKKVFVYALFIPFAIVDLLFLTSNSLKLLEGGFIPLIIGLLIFTVVSIWRWGRGHTVKAFEASATMTMRELVELQRKTSCDIPSTSVFLTRIPIKSLDDHTPISFQRFWDRNLMLPHHLVFLNVELLKIPHATERLVIKNFTDKNEDNGSITSITVQFGFMEDPNIEPLVEKFIRDKSIPSNQPAEKWVFKVTHERILPKQNPSLFGRFKFGLYSVISRNSAHSDEYFGLGKNHMLTVDVFPIQMQ